ncbi:hypothetical protein MUP59_04780 [Candidatus Bathyarchaeota archaeon]|nr:hypothetical protein [Candidatus Bathyarchaeota archaeon]
MVILRKAFAVMVVALLLASMLTLAFKVQPIETLGSTCAQTAGMIDTQTALERQEAGMLSEAPPTEWSKTYGENYLHSEFYALIPTGDGGYSMGGSDDPKGRYSR